MNQWHDPVNYTYIFNVLAANECDTLLGQKLDKQVEWGVRNCEDGKYFNNSCQAPHQPQRGAILYSSPSFHFRSGYHHKQKAKHMALSFWTFLQCRLGCSGKSHFFPPTAIWPQVVISNKVCVHWFLWTQTKAATTLVSPQSLKNTLVNQL